MIAFLFPGQGSQRPEMGASWSSHPSWELVDEASDLCERDVGRLLLSAQAEELTATQHAQLATYVLSMVVLDAIHRTGIEPTITAGHSLGEYSALTAAGSLSYAQAVPLVAERGDAMAQAGADRDGTMVALLGIDDDAADAVCAALDREVWVANYNAPGQVVIAGDPDAVRDASDAAKTAGARRAVPLAVSGAFHTPFMDPARDRLTKALSTVELRPAEIAVVANVDAAPHRDPGDWAALLVAQLSQPVRWHASVARMGASGADVFVEVGPGKTLSGLVKRTLDDIQTITINEPNDIDDLMLLLADSSQLDAGPSADESLYASERLVVSPSSGVFTWNGSTRVGTDIVTGDVLGLVGDTEVRSPFPGELIGVLALDGEQVLPSQPIAWLRSART